MAGKNKNLMVLLSLIFLLINQCLATEEFYNVNSYEDATLGNVSNDDLSEHILGSIGGSITAYGTASLTQYVDSNTFEGSRAVRLEAPNSSLIWVSHEMNGNLSGNTEYYYNMRVYVSPEGLGDGVSGNAGFRIITKYNGDCSGDIMLTINFLADGTIVYKTPASGGNQPVSDIPGFETYFRLTYAINPDPSGDGTTTLDRRVRIWVDGMLRVDTTYIDTLGQDYCGGMLSMWNTGATGTVWSQGYQPGYDSYLDNLTITDYLPPRTCNEVWDGGLGMSADLNKDCSVDFSDFALFAEQWLKSDDPNLIPELEKSVIDVRKFSAYALNIGEETEDWQPAFQKAIEKANETTKPIYVPTGEYKIRSAIDVNHTPKPGSFWCDGPVPIRIVGDGKGKSIIHQMVESENILNWSGPVYEESFAYGEIYGMTLWGGDIALNVKWHNHFHMDSCYIKGAQTGVHAEGWDDRFVNSVFQWCYDTAVYGCGHFNDAIIRDCYFSRNGVGISLHGGYGVRIEGTALETCANSAIYTHGMVSLTINNCYFEGNGYEMPEYFTQGLGYPSAVRLDYASYNISIHDNIFRGATDTGGGLVTIGFCKEGSIVDNSFLNSTNAIRLMTDCESNPGYGNFMSDTIVQHNYYSGVTNWLSEESSGLINTAESRGCVFEE